MEVYMFHTTTRDSQDSTSLRLKPKLERKERLLKKERNKPHSTQRNTEITSLDSTFKLTWISSRRTRRKNILNNSQSGTPP